MKIGKKYKSIYTSTIVECINGKPYDNNCFCGKVVSGSLTLSVDEISNRFYTNDFAPYKHDATEETPEYKIEHDFTHLAVCPYCGNMNMDSSELSKNDHKAQCSYCYNFYLYETHLSTTYSTKRISD